MSSSFYLTDIPFSYKQQKKFCRTSFPGLRARWCLAAGLFLCTEKSNRVKAIFSRTRFVMKPSNPADRHVVVLGASNKPMRYSNQALRRLLEQGFPVTPVHPRFEEIEGLKVLNHLSQVPQPVDTLTLYVGPERMQPMIEDVVKLKPGRVIFNPGSESTELKRRLEEAGIHWLEACTLVMLRIGTF